MDQPVSHQCSLSGTYNSAAFQLLINLSVVPGINDEGYIEVFVSLSGSNFNSSHKQTISLWSDSVYDFYDLSICVAYFADQEDTTEELPSSLEDSSYNLRVQWCLAQQLLKNYCFFLAARKTKKGVRHVVTFTLSDDNESEDMKCFVFESQQSELKKFSSDLVHVWEVIDKFIDEHPFGG